MLATDVRNLPWVPLEDWSELVESYGYGTPKRIAKSDVKHFLNRLFRRITCQLKLPYEEFEPIVEEKNAEFYRELEELYLYANSGYWLVFNEPKLLELQKLLKVPKLPNSNSAITPRVEKILSDFEALTEEEKRVVLKKLQTEQP